MTTTQDDNARRQQRGVRENGWEAGASTSQPQVHLHHCRMARTDLADPSLWTWSVPQPDDDEDDDEDSCCGGSNDKETTRTTRMRTMAMTTQRMTTLVQCHHPQLQPIGCAVSMTTMDEENQWTTDGDGDRDGDGDDSPWRRRRLGPTMDNATMHACDDHNDKWEVRMRRGAMCCCNTDGRVIWHRPTFTTSHLPSHLAHSRVNTWRMSLDGPTTHGLPAMGTGLGSPKGTGTLTHGKPIPVTAGTGFFGYGSGYTRKYLGVTRAMH